MENYSLPIGEPTWVPGQDEGRSTPVSAVHDLTHFGR